MKYWIILLMLLSAMSSQAVSRIWYQVLGVTEQSSQRDIKKAYKAMAIKYHPDKWVEASPAEQAQAAEQFKKYKQAYEIIMGIQAEPQNRFEEPRQSRPSDNSYPGKTFQSADFVAKTRSLVGMSDQQIMGLLALAVKEMHVEAAVDFIHRAFTFNTINLSLVEMAHKELMERYATQPNAYVFRLYESLLATYALNPEKVRKNTPAVLSMALSFLTKYPERDHVSYLDMINQLETNAQLLVADRQANGGRFSVATFVFLAKSYNNHQKAKEYILERVATTQNIAILTIATSLLDLKSDALAIRAMFKAYRANSGDEINKKIIREALGASGLSKNFFKLCIYDLLDR